MTQPRARDMADGDRTDRAGVKDKVTVRGLGDFVTMLGAVKSKQVDATIATISMIDAAKQEGWGATCLTSPTKKRGTRHSVAMCPASDAMCFRSRSRNAALQFRRSSTRWSGLRLGEGKHAGGDRRSDLPGLLERFSKEAALRSPHLQELQWNYSNVLDKATYDRLVRIMGDGRQFSNEELKGVPYRRPWT